MHRGPWPRDRERQVQTSMARDLARARRRHRPRWRGASAPRPQDPAETLPSSERKAAPDDREHSGQDWPQHLVRNAGRVMAADHYPRD
jgi:hypothetical protein